MASIDGKWKLLHRLLLDLPEGVETDHVNRNPADNRRSNLRVATRSQNLANRRPPARTRNYTGVCPNYNRWQARVGDIYVGVFATEEEAAKARDRAAQQIYGEFAVLNFPA